MARRKRSSKQLPIFKWLFRGKSARLGFWMALILYALWYVQDYQTRDDYVYAGVPRLNSYANPLYWVHVITNPGFMVGYSELRRNPLWAAYVLMPLGERNHLPRPGRFTVDWRTLMHVSHEDYSRSGYDRGHLAPNFAISQLYGRQAQKATFRMSNIVPQRPHLNQELWQRIEEIEIDHYARRFDKLWVLTGPVYDTSQQFLKSGVEIPDAFFKLLLDIDRNSKPRVLALLVPQTVKGHESLDKFVVTVDEVERQTGFDFYSQLPDDLENSLESSLPDKYWDLENLGRLAPRYRVGG